MKRNLFLLAISFLMVPVLASAVTVSPAKIIIKADPGQKVQAEIILKNEENSAKVFHPSFELFTEHEGTKIFTKNKSDLASWITIASSTLLQAGEKKSIPFTLKVPDNAPPGGHFAVMWWSGVPAGEAESNKDVSIVTRAGILFYLTVSGDVHLGADIDDFSAHGKFFFRTPIDFGVHVINTGNDYIIPRGAVTVYNSFGSAIAVLAINEKGYQILPSSGQGFNAEWSPGFAFGPYRAEAQITYGENPKTIVKSFWFFVMPWWSLPALIILAILGWAFNRGIKKYNEWIIGRARDGLSKKK